MPKLWQSISLQPDHVQIRGKAKKYSLYLSNIRFITFDLHLEAKIRVSKEVALPCTLLGRGKRGVMGETGHVARCKWPAKVGGGGEIRAYKGCPRDPCMPWNLPHLTAYSLPPWFSFLHICTRYRSIKSAIKRQHIIKKN